MMPLFRLTSIQKRYGARIALQLEELAIFPERLYVLTGPNGSGKTTLLNLLAFLNRPEQGDVYFAGERITWSGRQLKLLRRRVTLVHQSPYLFAGTVFDNVAFGLKARHTASEDLRNAVPRALATVGLKGFEERNVRQLSGGESRRVALARALVLAPEVLLLDEPLANLDEESAQVMETLITALPAQGTTVVISSHDLAQAERMATDVIRLVEGLVAQTAGSLDSSRQVRAKVQLCQPMKKLAESSSPA